MASKKSAQTLDQETAQLVNLRAENADLKAQLAESNRLQAMFKENSLRKEGVIQMLQKKVDRLEKASGGPAGETRGQRAIREHREAQASG